ncbi:MAG: TfoX/Sxy family protein [Gemmatimonadales bacterium]
MSVSPSFRTYVLEQLGRVAPAIRARSMFGGVGIYSADLFFALIDEDTVYFKVDDSNRAMFEARGMGPFEPYGPGGGSMQYYTVPEDVLENPEELQEWVEAALVVSRRKKTRRPRRGKS